MPRSGMTCEPVPKAQVRHESKTWSEWHRFHSSPPRACHCSRPTYDPLLSTWLGNWSKRCCKVICVPPVDRISWMDCCDWRPARLAKPAPVPPESRVSSPQIWKPAAVDEDAMTERPLRTSCTWLVTIWHTGLSRNER